MGYLAKGKDITADEVVIIQSLEPIGSALQLIRVNAAGTALEYTDPPVGSGTVTSVSVVTANGVSGSVATSTTTPAITLTLGAITPSSVNISGLTASEIVGTDASKNLVSLAVLTYPSLTELTYLKGVTSAIQTQIGLKANLASPTFSGTVTIPTPFTIGAVSMTATGTELNYVVGVTSAIQTQLDGKSPTAGNASLITVGTVTTGIWNATDVPVSAGGTGLSTISALAVWVANSANTITEVIPGAGNSIRINAGGTAWEAFTPAAAGANTALSNLASVAINLTLVSDTDNTDALGTTAIAWSDLFLGSGAVITFNSAPSTADITITHSVDTLTFAGGTIVLGTATAAGGLTGNVTGNVTGSAATVTGAAQTAITSLGTLTALTVDNLVIDLNTISSSSGNINITPVAGSNITLDGTVTVDAGVVAGMTSLTMSGNVIMGANSITMTGSIAATGARVTKGWFTDIESTNMPTVGGTAILTSLTAPQFTTIELGAASDTTLSRVSAGVVAVEGVNVLTVAGGTLTGNITLGENTSLDLDPAGSADGKYSGVCITGTAGAALTFGQLVYLAAQYSRWVLADADALATAGNILIGMCVLAAGADGNATKILLMGQIRADAQFPALTIGAAVYVGETAGAIQVAIPTGADNVIRVVGFALTADEIYFNPSQDHQTSVA